MKPKSKPIRVMIVDDHTVVREGLATLLDAYPELSFVGEASDGAEAIEQWQVLDPDVILMDLMMPEVDGVTAINEIVKSKPEIHILALTSFVEDDMVKAALKAGADGYLLKNISANELADAIITATTGETTLAPEATRALIDATISPPRLGHDLTLRERDVLAHMALGLTNAEIGLRLRIKSSTVKNHISNILQKMGAGSRTEVVALALKHKLVNNST